MCCEQDKKSRQVVRLAMVAIALSMMLAQLPASQLQAVASRGIGEDGTRFFVCEMSCGRIRVKKIGKNRYRVFSIGYSGDLEAQSEKQAAEKACGERDMTGSKRSPDVANRGGSCQ